MSIRQLAAPLVATTLILLALGATAASAHTTLRTDPGNVLIAQPTTVRATTSDVFTLFAPGTGQLDCVNASFDLEALVNTSATAIPATLTAFTATGCTDTFPVLGFTGCHLHVNARVHITANSMGGGDFRVTDPVLRCATTGVGACYFTSAVANGAYDNATASLKFANVPYTPIAATPDALGATCGNGGTWSVVFTHVIGGTAGQTLTVLPV
ncbi:hypothetical protein [Baekduia sp. Peel2402]|uniref:hypothetical protein n=1 Tax=Baekduia sp. Peel2402 TaxID=3458296 RepID=UPI00403E3C67